MSNLIQMPASTYTAKLFETAWGFKLAGTLDGFIDLVIPRATYPLTVAEARELIAALEGAIADVEGNCMGERDSLLKGHQ